MVAICSSRLFNFNVNANATRATIAAKSKLILSPKIPANDAIIQTIRDPPINCPALQSMFTIAWPAPLSYGFASVKTMYLKGAPMIVTRPTPIMHPAIMKNIKLLG